VIELAVVLDRAQLLDHRLRERQLHAGAAQPLVERIREHALEGDLVPAQQLAELADRVALRLHRLDARDGACRLDVAEVREQPDAVALDEERAVRAVEADEVLDVDRVRDEQRPVEPLLQSADTIAHVSCSFRYSRAIR
jgi:hypothetical protein